MIPLSQLGPRLPKVARRAIEAHLLRSPYEPSEPAAPAAAVFVTLRDADGSLRGCIGTLAPTAPDVTLETARSAVLAATRDPRFTPVELAELSSLHVEVSVLFPEEPVNDIADLDPRRYGVVVRDASGRRGLLLPDVPGVDDAVTQVDIARRKAGIAPGAVTTLSRFQVAKFTDGASAGA